MPIIEAISLTNSELTLVLLSILFLVSFAHLFGYLFQKIKLPRVIGEIFGGLLLGPTFFGFLSPELFSQIFAGSGTESKILGLIYWMGLLLLMFISGFEIEKQIKKADKKIAGILLIGSTLIPFVIGLFLAGIIDFSLFAGPQKSVFSLNMVIAIAISVTSIPVISKIFLDLGIIKTRFAKIVLITATIEDVFLWAALSIATSALGQAQFSISSIVFVILSTIIFFAVSLIVVQKLLSKAERARNYLALRISPIAYLLGICLIFSIVSLWFGINPIFGAFVAGILISKNGNLESFKAKDKIKDFSLAFFIPAYFAIVGFKLDLIKNFDLMFFLWFFVLAVGIKIIFTLISARAAKQGWKSALNFAMAMNTRGGPGIVVATVALDAGIINETLFTTLVMLAIITSLIGGAWFRLAKAKGEKLMD